MADPRAPRARVIALGQPAAGDDGVGPAVAARLAARGLPPGVELELATDASQLVDRVLGCAQVVVVDALLDGAPGSLHVLDPAALDAAPLTTLSSHGLSVGAALALARAIAGDAVAPRVDVVAVAIAPPERYGIGLSPAVEAAVDRAVDAVLRCVER